MSPARAAALHRVGTRGVLVDLDSLEDVLAWHAALTADPLPDQRDVIAAAQTLLVTLQTPAAARRAYERLSEFAPESSLPSGGREIVIDVVYDGEDLDAVADALGISAQALIDRHTEETWAAAFGGFAPGFTYCVATDGTWDIARRDSPRTAVPAGSVALAGHFSAVYPRETPGGWQLIGRTEAPMWDESAEPPARITPGDTVRYRAVRSHAEAAPGSRADPAPEFAAEPARASADAGSAARPVLDVVDAGLQTLFQDMGRPGFGDLGVASSGVVDRASAWTANRLVGNGRSAAVLENVGGLRLRALVDTVLAVTGAEAPLTVSGSAPRSSASVPRSHPLAHPVLLRAGEELQVGAAGVGMRSYVAARGGFAAREVLGSAATDVLSGLGPEPVQSGDRLKVRVPKGVGAVELSAPNPLRIIGTEATLRCVPGPREEWFDPTERARFAAVTWSVTGQSNRIGLRLAPSGDAEPLRRRGNGELASEGMISGSVQVPPNGNPVLFLADHPVTGGYPVIATVVAEDLDIVGQLPPGSTVRFLPVDPRTLLPVHDVPAAVDDAPAVDGGRSATGDDAPTDETSHDSHPNEEAEDRT
ncbi:urea amidolyase family protein [Brevibacterium daeguense]|uniref:Urea amidolyase family protein n=1 Tax=Brevibacterium daeguense TaxID=909936 RepID=A0ABP8EKW4_9MICO|nr:carboxyltransferase domain-containing protein [Brevibacterium daeguense]